MTDWSVLIKGGTKMEQNKDKSNTKNKILSSAKKIFQEKGFYKTTMDEIAKEAKVAKGTLYIHFQSKKILFFEIIKNEILNIIETFQKINKNEKLNPKQKIIKGIKIASRKWAENKKFFLALFWEDPIIKEKDLRKKQIEIWKKLVETIKTTIKEGIAKGFIVNENPEFLTFFLIGITNSTISGSIILYPEKEPPDYSNSIIKILEKGFFLK